MSGHQVFYVRNKIDNNFYQMRVVRSETEAEKKELEEERDIQFMAAKGPFSEKLIWFFEATNPTAKQNKGDYLKFLCHVSELFGGFFDCENEVYSQLQREKHLPEKRVKFIATELALALAFLHSKGYIDKS
jgi:serine/threonine protein kinase